MADFTALKTAIRNYIKQNGNEEITGAILQDILLSVVTTLGDSAINDLITDLSNEVTARTNADSSLEGAINQEGTLRSNADSRLEGLITGITNNIDNGYVYAGIATPSTTPVTGKVFYLALQGGTYTNFGNTAVMQGINIFKYNGSSWLHDAYIAISDKPIPSGTGLVKAGGTFDFVMDNGSAFDISKYFASGSTLATYADLSAALTALNGLDAAYKRGGMSIRFVQSSDNKYVQFRYMLDATNIGNFLNIDNWQGVDTKPTAGSRNLVESDGTKQFVAQLHTVTYENGTLNNSTGLPQNSTTRFRTSDYIYPPILVKANEGYSVRLYTYNQNNEFVADGDWVSSINLLERDYNLKYKLIFRKDDNSNISISDISNFSIQIEIPDVLNNKQDKKSNLDFSCFKVVGKRAALTVGEAPSYVDMEGSSYIFIKDFGSNNIESINIHCYPGSSTTYGVAKTLNGKVTEIIDHNHTEHDIIVKVDNTFNGIVANHVDNSFDFTVTINGELVKVIPLYSSEILKETRSNETRITKIEDNSRIYIDEELGPVGIAITTTINEKPVFSLNPNGERCIVLDNLNIGDEITIYGLAGTTRAWAKLNNGVVTEIFNKTNSSPRLVTLVVDDTFNGIACNFRSVTTYVPYVHRITDADRYVANNLNKIKPSGTISIKNSDKILVLGSSSVQSLYALPNKSWEMKLNDFLDWVVISYGKAGYDCEELVATLNNDVPSFYSDNVKPSEMCPTYVYFGHYKNMSDIASEETSVNFVDANRRLAQAIQNVFNAKIILGSDYSSENSYHCEMAMAQLAEELGVMYAPFGIRNDNVIGPIDPYRKQNVWKGSHPGTRTNGFYYQEALNLFSKLERPTQSIKLYKPRTGVVDFTYSNIFERAKKFYSVQVGESALNSQNAAYYDKLTEVPSTGYYDNLVGDYFKLQENVEVNFGSTLLCEIILPVVNTDQCRIYFASNEDLTNLTVSVYNYNTKQYDSMWFVESQNGLYYVDIVNRQQFSFDAIRLLFNNTTDNVILTNIYVEYYGGKEKKNQMVNGLNDYTGHVIFGGNGFGSNWETVWDNTDNLESYYQADKYGSNFVDIPYYLGNSKVIVLPFDATTKKKITLPVLSNTIFGDIQTKNPLKIRVEVYARSWIELYDATAYGQWTGDNNPYSDQPTITDTSYDYCTLCLDVTNGKNNKTAVFEKPVGLWWSRIVFDVFVPPFTESNFNFSLYRKVNDISSNYELQIADVVITRIE